MDNPGNNHWTVTWYGKAQLSHLSWTGRYRMQNEKKKSSLPSPPLCDILFKRSRKCYTAYVQRHAVSGIHVTAKWRKASNKNRWPVVIAGVQSGHCPFQGRRQWAAYQCSVSFTHLKNPWSYIRWPKRPYNRPPHPVFLRRWRSTTAEHLTAAGTSSSSPCRSVFRSLYR